MKNIFLSLILLIAWLNMNCGKGIVEATDESYESKIVIEGYLVAGQPVDHIRITRNFPLSANVNNGYLLPDANKTTAVITDLENNRTYPLSFFNSGSNQYLDYWWEYRKDDLQIRPGQSYQLDVWAEIDGRPMHAWSTTHVPEAGFQVVSLNADSMTYKALDADNNPDFFKITVDQVPGSDCYIAFITAQDNRLENFIYDNPYEDLTPEDVEKDLDSYSKTMEGMVNSEGGTGQAMLILTWDEFWFYGDYQVVVGAADQNYADFLMTYDMTQEMDGNFHEALFHVEGDGIGVFGSMVTDTLRVTVME